MKITKRKVIFRRLVLVTLSAVLLVLVISRIIWLNFSTSLSETIQIYEVGDTVDFDNCFFYSKSESAPGYSIEVISYEITSYEDFVTKNGAEIDYIPLVSEDGVMRPQYVFDVEARLINENNTDSYLLADNFFIQYPNEILRVNYDLWSLVTPQLDGSISFKLRPNSDFVVHFPFVVNAEYFSFYEEEYTAMLERQNCYFVVTQYPIKKLVFLPSKGRV